MTDLDARYGRRRRRPRWVLPVVAAVLIAAGLAWVTWVALQDRPVSAEVYGYDVKGPHVTDITIDVYRSRSVALRCTVAAQAHDHSTVGELTFKLPAKKGHTRHQLSVDTGQRAVTGIIEECDPIE